MTKGYICFRLVMKSGEISVSGYWPRELNPGFRGNLWYNYQLCNGDSIRS